VPGKKIVQTWRASDWPDGVESKVTIVLSQEDESTRLEFNQTGVPDDFYNDIKQGWQDYYWHPLQTFLDK
jgi:activator of HSP90 ATPase